MCSAYIYFFCYSGMYIIASKNIIKRVRERERGHDGRKKKTELNGRKKFFSFPYIQLHSISMPEMNLRYSEVVV